MNIQGSPEWLAERVGKLGASRVHEALAKTKSGWGASRGNLIAELIAERLTGAPAERFSNAAMLWGTATEPEARMAYEFMANVRVVETGFVLHPTIGMTGASPDGLVGDDGLVEIKAPNTATHIETMLGASIPDKYRTQMAWQLSCTGRQWCDFVSYDPRLPENLRIRITRFERSDRDIAELEQQVVIFLNEVDEKERRLRQLGAPSALKGHLIQSVIMAG